MSEDSLSFLLPEKVAWGCNNGIALVALFINLCPRVKDA